ncbi:MAG: porin family protein [Balneolaceae bacterium]
MKSILIVLFWTILIIQPFEALAQNFGIKAGLNISEMFIEDDDGNLSDDYDSKAGLHFGLIAEYPINENLNFETGLLISQKGFKGSLEETLFGETLKADILFKTLYLDIPLNAKAAHTISNKQVFGIFGPYIAIGLTGEYESEFSYMGESETDNEDINWGNDEDDDLRRLDYGLNAGAGIEINSIQFRVSYSLGLANVSAYRDSGTTMKHRVLSLSVAYMF